MGGFAFSIISQRRNPFFEIESLSLDQQMDVAMIDQPFTFG
jgi:hypothetical protein